MSFWVWKQIEVRKYEKQKPEKRQSKVKRARATKTEGQLTSADILITVHISLLIKHLYRSNP